jgi:hypothetical protein
MLFRCQSHLRLLSPSPSSSSLLSPPPTSLIVSYPLFFFLSLAHKPLFFPLFHSLGSDDVFVLTCPLKVPAALHHHKPLPTRPAFRLLTCPPTRSPHSWCSFCLILSTTVALVHLFTNSCSLSLPLSLLLSHSSPRSPSAPHMRLVRLSAQATSCSHISHWLTQLFTSSCYSSLLSHRSNFSLTSAVQALFAQKSFQEPSTLSPLCKPSPVSSC